MSALLISNFAFPSHAKEALSSTSFAIAESVMAKGDRNFINSCEKAPNQLASSINNLTNNKFKTKQQAEVSDQKHRQANSPQKSIWWAVQQFDPFGGNLIQDWLTHPQQQQIHLTVDFQLWTLLDYFGRYRFVNQFGTVARKYGYDLNIFNQKEQCLAIYQYNSISQPPKWELHLQKLGQDSLQVDEPEQQSEN